MAPGAKCFSMTEMLCSAAMAMSRCGAGSAMTSSMTGIGSRCVAHLSAAAGSSC